MSKPWMKFYPADWQADPALRSCSLSARGLWVEMLAVMQKSERVGHLLVNGKAPSPRVLAVLCGAASREVSRGLDELASTGVFSRDGDGVIFSRRMVRDEERAARDKANGGRGGNPRLKAGDNGGVNPSDNGGDKAQKPEARGQKDNARGPRLDEAVLERIWSEAPSKARERSSKADVRKALIGALGRGGDFEQISRALGAYWRSEDASKDGGAYAKGIHRMIEGDRWKDWASGPQATARTGVDWPERVRIWRATGQWLLQWGAEPGDPQCQCPPDLLEEPF